MEGGILPGPSFVVFSLALELTTPGRHHGGKSCVAQDSQFSNWSPTHCISRYCLNCVSTDASWEVSGFYLRGKGELSTVGQRMFLGLRQGQPPKTECFFVLFCCLKVEICLSVKTLRVSLFNCPKDRTSWRIFHKSRFLGPCTMAPIQ